MNHAKLIPLILYSTVFSTGAAVLVMEVVAVRLLSPYFGSSLYVLSSVLTIVLFALSMGYYFGGRISDKLPFHTPLYVIIFLGGASFLFITLFSLIILPIIAPHLPIALGPLFISGLLFFFPALLLGIDSPYVIKLLTLNVEKEKSGSVVGTTFFWSTAGSITGSLLAGFVLVPTFGLNNTMLGTGIFLIVLGVGGGFLLRHFLKKNKDYDTRNELKIRFFKEWLLGIFTLIFVLSQATPYANALYYKDGYYSSILIYDGNYKGEPARFLKRDINNSSAIYLENDSYVYPYAQFVELYRQLVPDASNFLMLGGGAYTIPRKVHLNNPAMHIDVIEIEPSLHTLAKEYFRLPETDSIVNHLLDARVYLQRTNKKYDVIFIDTFNTGHFVPPHLASKEFFEAVSEALTANGIVIMNFIGKLHESNTRTLTGSFTKTFQSVLPNVEIYTTAPRRYDLPINIMYVAQKGTESMPINQMSMLLDNYGKITTLKDLKILPEEIIQQDDVIFTDDFAPIEPLLLKDQISSY